MHFTDIVVVENRYLKKHALFERLLPQLPYKTPGIIVVIPCHNEPDLLTTLISLSECHQTSSITEVIVVINQALGASDEVIRSNLNSAHAMRAFKESHDTWFDIHSIEVFDLNPKYAGVGLARKIGMDEAVRRINENGIILCLDADCIVDRNYLQAVESHFADNEDINGCSIYFEHPLSGTLPAEVYKAIMQYELHLRYFVDMQRRLGLPYAYHTVGSSMAVKNMYYQQVGGMNKRKAGEDFYFIQKLVKQGKYSTCNTTRVVPSPRISDRVPFGTGKAIGEMLKKGQSELLTYHPRSFDLIGEFVNELKLGYKSKNVVVPEQLRGLYSPEFFKEKLDEVISNTSNESSYLKRIFDWFDAFRLMKTLHFLRDNYYPSIPVLEAVKVAGYYYDNSGIQETLRFYRELDKHSSI